jgi:hypothetical protein
MVSPSSVKVAGSMGSVNVSHMTPVSINSENEVT